MSTGVATKEKGFVDNEAFIVECEVEEVEGGMTKDVIVDTLDHLSVKEEYLCNYELDNMSWSKNKENLEKYVED